MLNGTKEFGLHALNLALKQNRKESFDFFVKRAFSHGIRYKKVNFALAESNDSFTNVYNSKFCLETIQAGYPADILHGLEKLSFLLPLQNTFCGRVLKNG